MLEGVAYQIRENLAVTEEVGGPVAQVIVYGGGAKSSLWCEIIADVLGRPICWTETAETAGLGAAMLAGLGSGVFASLGEARSRIGACYPSAGTAHQPPTIYASIRTLSSHRGTLAGS